MDISNQFPSIEMKYWQVEDITDVLAKMTKCNGMKQSEEIKIAVLSYWKNIRHHPIGGLEIKNADVLTITRAGMITETEVKISIADMRRETKTKWYKHFLFNNGGTETGHWTRTPHYFYFAVPESIAEQAKKVISELYPYAGLLVYNNDPVNQFSIYSNSNNRISATKNSKRFKREKMGIQEFTEICTGVTNTAIRYMGKYILGEGNR